MHDISVQQMHFEFQCFELPPEMRILPVSRGYPREKRDGACIFETNLEEHPHGIRFAFHSDIHRAGWRPIKATVRRYDRSRKRQYLATITMKPDEEGNEHAGHTFLWACMRALQEETWQIHAYHNRNGQWLSLVMSDGSLAPEGAETLIIGRNADMDIRTPAAA